MTERTKEIVKARKVGVAFVNHDKDDIKSKVFRLFTKKKREKGSQKTWALEDITFDGCEGEILGIIGSNGAGKTTISKVIAGILEADRGSINVDGRVTALFSYGMGFNQELTGRENVYLNGMMLGISKEVINEYIEDIVEFSELGRFIDQPMKRYSSGMKSRLGFSVASHLQPEILILDEALNTGDAKFSKKASEKLKKLVKEAKMVIMVTHSLGFAEKNCDRLIWLAKGKVKSVGEPKEIIEMYKATMPPKKPKKKRILDFTETKTETKDKVVVELKDAGVSFNLRNDKDKFWALKDINLKVKEGEVLGVIGHNGAGKSTLCKLLTSIYRADEGEVQVFGETSSLLGYGTGFNPQLTGRDNVYLNAMLLGIPKERVVEKFDEIVDFSGIKKAIDNPVKTYSSGMKSRLGFSIAASLKPDVFIIDEALSTGDMEFQQRASERIQEMIGNAKAVIIVSHNLNFVEKVCTRAIWMEQGKLRYDGSSKDAVRLYKESLNMNRKKA